jgi:hypothetical protein
MKNSHMLLRLLACMCIAVNGCSNEFDKQYDAAMQSATKSLQNKDFTAAADTYFSAMQIRHTSNDRLNEERALKGFYESCGSLPQEERGSRISKLKTFLSTLSSEDQEIVLQVRSGKGEIDSSIGADVRSAVAASLRSRVSQGRNWKEELALELRIAGIAVSKIGDDPITIDKEYHPIWLFGKVNVESDRSTIEKTVKEFLAKHPEVGPHDSVGYFDEERERGTIVKQRGVLVKVCDL